jgi:hypothetical protein
MRQQEKSITMKKAILFTFLITMGLMQEIISQNSKPVLPDNIKILNPGNGYLNSLNTRALRDFLSKYENATDVVWYNVDKGYVVRFRIDSMFSRSAYKSNGHWVYTIKQYLEAQMPKAVRALVKSTYYDYAITLIEEIEQPNEHVKYLVHLQDNVSWKNVLVSDGQMELVEDKKKL